MPPTDAAARDGAIRARLREVADPSGFIAFDRFLEVALYHPEVGYYAAVPTLGASGDFYTAAHVHPVFAATITNRILDELAHLGTPQHFRVVEVGPGDGSLAVALLDALVPAVPGGTELEYVLVEPSPTLRSRIADRLASHPHRDQVRFADALAADGPFTGVVVANELLDALPFRRMIARHGEWVELGVRLGADRVEWAEGSASRTPPPSLPSAPADGTILELNSTAEAYLREIGDHLEAGAALLLDYGSDEGDLLGGHPHGTLAAVRQHRPVDDPLVEPGTTDLSAFVNFTRIRAAAATSGLREVAYGSQAEALVRWGIEAATTEAVRRAGSAEAEVKTRLAVKNLLFGFGTFRVLELRAGASPT